MVLEMSHNKNNKKDRYSDQPNKSCYNESMVSKTQHINPGCDVLPKRRHSCINVPTITHLQNTLEKPSALTEEKPIKEASDLERDKSLQRRYSCAPPRYN